MCGDVLAGLTMSSPHRWNDDRGNPDELSGSSFSWVRVDEAVYDGSYAGTCQYFPDLDGNGRADLHSITGTWHNFAETWFNPDCGLPDNQGDDGNIVDPKLPEQPGNPVGGPGPSPEDPDDTDCHEMMDDRPWRVITCTHPLVESHTKYTQSERWNGIDVPGALVSTNEFWQCWLRKKGNRDNYANSVSDYWHGPPSMFCEDWRESGNGCKGFSIQCDDTVTGPQGHFILNSYIRLYDVR